MSCFKVHRTESNVDFNAGVKITVASREGDGGGVVAISISDGLVKLGIRMETLEDWELLGQKVQEALVEFRQLTSES